MMSATCSNRRNNRVSDVILVETSPMPRPGNPVRDATTAPTQCIVVTCLPVLPDRSVEVVGYRHYMPDGIDHRAVLLNASQNRVSDVILVETSPMPRPGNPVRDTTTAPTQSIVVTYPRALPNSSAGAFCYRYYMPDGIDHRAVLLNASQNRVSDVIGRNIPNAASRKSRQGYNNSADAMLCRYMPNGIAEQFGRRFATDITCLTALVPISKPTIFAKTLKHAYFNHRSRR